MNRVPRWLRQRPRRRYTCPFCEFIGTRWDFMTHSCTAPPELSPPVDKP